MSFNNREFGLPKIIVGFAAVASAALLSVAPLAAHAKAPNTADIAAGTYHADPHHTQILFTYSHLGLTRNMGLVSGATGILVLNPENPAADKLSVTVPIKTLHTTIAALDQEMQSPMFFDAAKYPTAHFQSTKVTVKGTSATIDGNLTIHGVTRPAVIHARLLAAGMDSFAHKKTIAFEGHATIDRTKFGVGKFAPEVGAKVDLKITAAFQK